MSEEDQDKAVFYVGLGQNAIRGGKLADGEGFFVKAVELNPGNSDALVGLGEVKAQQGQHAAAIATLQKAVKLRKTAKAYTLIGESYLAQGKTSDAATAFKTALQIRPGDERARQGFEKASEAGGVPTTDSADAEDDGTSDAEEPEEDTGPIRRDSGTNLMDLL